MKRKGFTLMEVMVVVAVLAILVVLALVNVNKTRSQTRDKVRIANLQEIRLAIEEYRAKCGEYPARLDEGTNNGCPSGISLDNYLSEVPENPMYSEQPIYYQQGGYDENDTYNGYLYAALTSSLGGKCFDYHIGVPLESSREEDSYSNSGYFSEDHDCPRVTLSSTPYNRVCATSNDDFRDADSDVNFGIYDLRSANNC